MVAESPSGRSLPEHVSLIPVAAVEILGVRFHPMRMEQAVDTIQAFISAGVPSQINFGNAQTIALCRRNPFIRDLMNRAQMTLPDGMSIVWGGRMLGFDIPERVAGPDFMTRLCDVAAKKGQSIFLLGTSEENLAALSAALRRDHPGLRVAGTYSPPMRERFSDAESDQMVSVVNESGAQILFVGISCPKQEEWISRNLHRLKPPVALAVGAAFDFLSGKIPRAPDWFQRNGLEWLFRFSREPLRLWERYLWGNAVFVALLVNQRVRRWFTGRPLPGHRGTI